MPDSIYIHNSHNVSNLVYHFVCPTKYRRVVITETVDESLKQICEGIELRYDWITFLEIGADKDRVHFLVQSAPDYSPTKIITTIKSITAKRIFAEHPEVKKQLWGGNFWSIVPLMIFSVIYLVRFLFYHQEAFFKDLKIDIK